MSFQYGHFGTGFKRASPAAEALRFGALVETRGETVHIILLAKTGEDGYGNPIHAESKHPAKAFVEGRGQERVLMPGTVKGGTLKLFMTLWAPMKEEDHEVEVEGLRYHVTSLVKTRACLEAELERKAG